jgi:hypothetical protein
VSTTDELRDAGVPVEPEETQSQLFMTVLRGLGYRFRLNLSDDSIEVNSIGTKLSDIIAARIRMQMRDRGVKRDLKAIEDAYTAEAEANAYHPIKDYFNNLAGKWDGKDRVTELALKLKGDSGIIEYEDGRRVPVHAVYLVRWMIGVVAKALDGLQNPMLTLDGGQGIGKSLLAAWLCPHPDWFVEGPINTQDKDCDVRLMTKLIWEVSELDAKRMLRRSRPSSPQVGSLSEKRMAATTLRRMRWPALLGRSMRPRPASWPMRQEAGDS